MSYICGVKCDCCGAITFFERKMDKTEVFNLMKANGWKIIRKSGQRAEKTYCCEEHMEIEEARK